MKNHLHTISVGALAVALAGCAAAPLSQIDGHPFTRTDPHLYSVRIISVDGSINFGDKAVQVGPGPHTLMVAAAPGQTALGFVEKIFAFKVEPCTSYHFAARRESPMQSDWALVVESKDPVAGCNAEEEWKKAGISTSSAGNPATAAASVPASTK